MASSLAQRNRILLTSRIGVILFCVLEGSLLFGGENRSAEVEDPHFDPSRCSSCHDPGSANEQELKYGGDLTRLCLSCHDGEKAKRELHPAELVPSAEIRARIPEDFPLHEGRLACSTCHDIRTQCDGGPRSRQINKNFLRGDTRFPLFCFQCHIEEAHAPFNAHDQLGEDGQRKDQVCLWCHLEVPEVTSFMKKPKDFGLRSDGTILCRNCHIIDDSHPVGGTHIRAKPTEQILKDMARYIGIPPEQYSSFQVIPLDGEGRIACFTCHNPHQKGLIPNINLRSLGAEPAHAVHDRLRRKNPSESPCRPCHNY